MAVSVLCSGPSCDILQLHSRVLNVEKALSPRVSFGGTSDPRRERQLVHFVERPSNRAPPSIPRRSLSSFNQFSLSPILSYFQRQSIVDLACRYLSAKKSKLKYGIGDFVHREPIWWSLP